MIRAAFLTAALALTGAGFAGPILAAGDDNDPHMRFPTERGWELKGWQRDDRTPRNGEKKSMEGKPGRPSMNGPKERREGTPGGGQGSGAPGGRY